MPLASSVNLVRRTVWYGVAIERVTSDKARPMVFVPTSRPSSRASRASKGGRSSMATRGATVTRGASRGVTHEDHVVRPFLLPYRYRLEQHPDRSLSLRQRHLRGGRHSPP